MKGKDVFIWSGILLLNLALSRLLLGNSRDPQKPPWSHKHLPFSLTGSFPLGLQQGDRPQSSLQWPGRCTVPSPAHSCRHGLPGAEMVPQPSWAWLQTAALKSRFGMCRPLNIYCETCFPSNKKLLDSKVGICHCMSHFFKPSIN